MDIGVDMFLPSGTAEVRRRSLLAYTTIEILVGLTLLVWTTVTVPIYSPIDPSLAGTALEGPLGGTLLWILFGFLGSLRVLRRPGGGVFTFHLAFVGAAMVLGGPTAGAWVAFLSTIELRELEEQPWYGLLANHAAFVIGAVIGGVTSRLVIAAAASPSDPGLPVMVAAVAGTVALAIVTTALAAGTWILRDELSPRAIVGIMAGHLGGMTALEVGLAWVLVMAYAQVGWWTPVVIGGLILLVWRDPEPPKSIERRLEDLLGALRSRRMPGATVCSAGIDDRHAVAIQYGPTVLEQVQAEFVARVGAEARRPHDAAEPLGDAGVVVLLLPGLVDGGVARRRAVELWTALTAPIATSAGPISVQVSVGMEVLLAGGTVPSAGTVLRHIEEARVRAERGGGGVHPYDPAGPHPFDGTRGAD